MATAGYLADDLAGRLSLSAGFRNVVAHLYDELDMRRVHEAATRGPGDLRAFLRLVRDLAEPS